MPLFPWTYWGHVGTVSKRPCVADVEAHCPWVSPTAWSVTIWIFTRRPIGESQPKVFTESLQKACLYATALRSRPS